MKGVFGDVDQEEKCQRRKLLKERGRIGRGAGRLLLLCLMYCLTRERESLEILVLYEAEAEGFI